MRRYGLLALVRFVFENAIMMPYATSRSQKWVIKGVAKIDEAHLGKLNSL
jgi:hypothetical protein